MSLIYAAPTYALGQDYIMEPGARLEVGPGGKLYESMGAEEAIAIVAKSEASKAASAPDQKAEATRAIAKMKRSLRDWLKYRRINDEVASGKRKADTPAFVAAATLNRDRDWIGEQKLAEDLHMLLAQIYDPSQLPRPDVRKDMNAAVKLACIALAGKAPSSVSSPQATGIWPIVILTVGGLLLFTATSFISNRAEVAKEKERMMCIRDGACTDFGFWLKAAAVVTIGYFAWGPLGGGEKIRALVHRKGGVRRARARR